ncbi:MAG: alkaline phosphatase family protein [Anaerolineaceae bacterium]|nr:alkaline phosphatase family protein [Anaerolineaceae bacterium]MCB9098103.1 alkaline phosphatase family protein [Anaerolineales bacterium]
MRHLCQPENLTLAYFCDSYRQADGDQCLANEAARFLTTTEFDFAFVYFGTVDTAGHDYGWLSPEYLAQLERVDHAFGTLVAALPDDTTLLVQSDHGGPDHNHWTDRPEDMTIPWLIAGPDIRSGYEIQAAISLLDTAPTLARLLNLKPHPDWEGRCIEEIFR